MPRHKNGGMSPIAEVQLSENIADDRFGPGFRKPQPLRDAEIAVANSQLFKDQAFCGIKFVQQSQPKVIETGIATNAGRHDRVTVIA